MYSISLLSLVGIEIIEVIANVLSIDWVFAKGLPDRAHIPVLDLHTLRFLSENLSRFFRAMESHDGFLEEVDQHS